MFLSLFSHRIFPRNGLVLRCLQSFHVLQFPRPRALSSVAMSRLPGQIKMNDYLVMYFSARVIGRGFFFVLGVCLALVLCPTVLFCCSLRVDLLLLVDKGQEVNALPVLVDQGRRTFFFLLSLLLPSPLLYTHGSGTHSRVCFFISASSSGYRATLKNSPRDTSCDFCELKRCG